MFTNSSLNRTLTSTNSSGSATVGPIAQLESANNTNASFPLIKSDLANLSITNTSLSSLNSVQQTTFGFVDTYNSLNRKQECPGSVVKQQEVNNLSSQGRQVSYEFHDEQDTCLQLFDKWSPVEQNEFCENLLRRMCHFQHGHINNFLTPMLQRDFISSLPGKPHLAKLDKFKHFFLKELIF